MKTSEDNKKGEDSDEVAMWENKNGFLIPADYFDGLPEKILENIINQEQKTITPKWYKISVSIAAVALLLLTSLNTFILVRSSNSEDPIKQVGVVNTQAVPLSEGTVDLWMEVAADHIDNYVIVDYLCDMNKSGITNSNPVISGDVQAQSSYIKFE